MPTAKAVQNVKITGAKGRPMLSWVGKRPLDFLEAFPAQKVETFGSLEPPKTGWEEWPAAYPHGGVLLHGDNKECLAHLLAAGFRGQVKLIYIDPPFDSGADYIRKVQLRGIRGQATLEGQSYSLGEQIQYTDIWANDNYLQFIYERLLMLKELLADNGSIFLHCDWRKAHYLRCLLDEVFGADNFMNEVVWVHQIMGGSINRFPKAHETIFWYRKGEGVRLCSDDANVRVPYSDYVLGTMQKDEEGRFYYERRRMSRKATEEEAASKAHTRTYVDNPDAGTIASDVWSDMLSYQELPNERDGVELYPTQKTKKLLTRIISAASKPGDIVLDCFIGSATTAAVAQKLGRRWIGCDINKGAIQSASKRLQNIIAEQRKQNGTLGDDCPPAPAQLGFSVWRVNDYDLNVAHLEAVELACQKAGVTRTRSDSFFDGTVGDKLVKIVPFQHPLSPADIEAVKSELKTRPEETRSILMVSLGVEGAARVALSEWNQFAAAARHDEAGNPIDYVNKIEALDLREGGFFVHQNASARLKIERTSDGKNQYAKVTIEDFISPTILTRLNADANIFAARVDGWKSSVDCVLIDADYDGEIFNVALSDIPPKKDDMVRGIYEIPIGKAPVTIAVKLIDMLGEEVIESKEI